MGPAFLSCESHPGRPLVDHLVEVHDLLQPLPVTRWVPNLPLAGLCHDLAKATGYFQSYLRGSPIDLRRKSHAFPSAVIFLSIVGQLDVDGERCLERGVLYQFIRRHHGALDNLLDAISIDSLDRVKLEAQLAAIDVTGMAAWLEARGQRALPPLTIGDPRSWTAMRRRICRELDRTQDEIAAMRRMQRTLAAFGGLIDADRDSAAQVASLPPASLEFTESRLSDYRTRIATAGSEPNVTAARSRVFDCAVQHAQEQPWQGAQLWSLTVPTGAGKTLAALGWAMALRDKKQRATGRPCPIIYALPFTSIIDQNADVLASICGTDAKQRGVVATHHHLSEYGDRGALEDGTSPRAWAEAWKAEVTCTTFVQVFNALFHGRTSDARRFSRLADGILILDEVQAIPSRLWTVSRLALASLADALDTDVLLVTATQPAIFAERERREIGPAEGSLWQTFDRYDLEVEPEELSLEALAQRLLEEIAVERAPSCLVVLNTVREALKLFELVGTATSIRERLYHLSTNLRPKDRRPILRRVSAGASPILISTQVVEAGVDLSFERVFRAWAPMDSIIQAAGRCNRNGAGPRGRVTVVRPEGNTDSRIYGPVLMGAASEVLAAGRISERDLRDRVRQYFETVAARISSDRATAVIGAVRQLEFAALRGEDPNGDPQRKKQVALIESPDIGVPHFIDADEDDHHVWKRLEATRDISDPRQRSAALRQVRPEIEQRVVEVPKRDASEEPDPETGLVYVHRSQAQGVYSKETGWRRQL